jgi:hypothetical protein
MTLHVLHTYRQAQRGSTTLIAILVLFALMGLGLLSMRHTYHDMSSAGNLRRAKQARFIAEVGANHAITLMQQQGSYLLGLRQPNDILELNHLGVLSYISINNAGIEALRMQINTPPLNAFDQGPKPVGELVSQVPSYEVRIEGITDGTPPPGQELSQSDLGTPRQSYCMIQVTSRGYLSRAALPEENSEALTEEQWKAAAELVAEHRVKAALTVGPFMIQSCRL